MNKNLDYIFKILANKKIDAYYLPLSNEHLYEFTKFKDNYVYELSGFTGDTASLFLYKKVAYLFVDGRFVIQAKNEINDKRLKIIEVNSNSEKIDFIISKLINNKSILINPKLISIYRIINLQSKLNKYNIKIIFNDNIFKSFFNDLKKNCFHLTSAPLFILDKKYVGETSKNRINNLIIDIYDTFASKNDIYYVTSNLEEIAYLTNIRFKLCDISDESVLFESFLIINNKKSILYLKDYLSDNDIKYLNKNNIFIKNINCFYKDLKKIKSKCVYIDKKINNYYIYKTIHSANLIDSPLYIKKSVKNNTEIKNLKKSNIIDGVAMVKAIYCLKNNDYRFKSNKFKTEYDIKLFIDNLRKYVGKKMFLCNSFETIVAYKENSAICHYTPKKNKSKKINDNGLLLIDSGGNYLTGTTDITRTISLYKNINNIPKNVKMHYTLVLKSLIDLSILIFPSGLTGSNIDIIARKNLYDNFLDFNHGTGHGIGYISNVHEGPNIISPSIKNNYNDNILQENQVSSNEPGLYFENKYGIRLENDIIVKKVKENIYGEFFGFDTLTLCPFDKDLIDKKYLDNNEIQFINSYNQQVYNKLSKYLTDAEKKWLKVETSEV
ncbi:MAG: M24 family metallopeptidase [Lachnospiraceae bacterium]|nr:M24 family metallopeptidase [Lachnospiraceae bacterium]